MPAARARGQLRGRRDDPSRPSGLDGVSGHHDDHLLVWWLLRDPEAELRIADEAGVTRSAISSIHGSIGRRIDELLLESTKALAQVIPDRRRCDLHDPGDLGDGSVEYFRTTAIRWSS